MRTILFPMMLLAVLAASACLPKPAIKESKTDYPILQPGDVARIHVIFEGLVVRDGMPAGPVRKSPLDGGLAQLWKGRVQVENVLQGEVKQGQVDVFYFVGNLPGSARSIRLRSGERSIFFLRRDGTNLRTNDDRSANTCLLKVITGPHRNFNKGPGVTIGQAIVDLLLTRGNGVDDKTMIAAIGGQRYSRFFDEEQIVSKLREIVKSETAVVREAACLQLLDAQHPCGHDEATPALAIRNLTRPDGSGICKQGDRIQVTVAGAAHQAVYRSSTGRVGVTDANGRFTFIETLHDRTEWTHTDVWSIGTDLVSPAVTYSFGRKAARGRIFATAIGNPRDQYGMGISALSVLGDKVITYSGMLLDYRTGLYYDAQEVGTLYEDGKPIKSGSMSGSTSARQLWETKVIYWDDYFIQGKHYAVAAFRTHTFLNPMRFAKGACFGMRGNCQIVPLDGPAQAGQAAILLGNTGGDQLAVWQPGSQSLRILGPDSKEEMLDDVLTRAEGANDAYMIAVIDQVSHERAFSNGLLVEKLQDLAGHETTAVRAKACSELRRLKHPCKAVPHQENKPAAPGRNGLETAIPRYLVWTHFLLMLDGPDEEKRVAAFGRQWLTQVQLNAFKGESSALTQELAILDLRAKKVTAAFRKAGRLALQEGRPLPPAPAQIVRLQAMRTAAMVNHVVVLRSRLGARVAIDLEANLVNRSASASSFMQPDRNDR